MLLFLYYSRYYNFITDYMKSNDIPRLEWRASMVMPDDVSDLVFVILNILFNFIMFIIMFAAATGAC